MALYAIGDLHLAFGCPEKDMSVFGDPWIGYAEKIRTSFATLSDADTCVLCGDTSWGMSLEEALPDFRFLNDLPGKKLLIKGNHDFWWSTAHKMNRFLQDNGLDKLAFLHNSCAPYGAASLCGTRGWFYEEEKGGAHDAKIMAREIGRLEASLAAAGEGEKLVFLHYPPLYQSYRCAGILEALARHGVRECCYGHIHGKGAYAAFRGEEAGIRFRLVSADSLGFIPAKIR